MRESSHPREKSRDITNGETVEECVKDEKKVYLDTVTAKSCVSDVQSLRRESFWS